MQKYFYVLFLMLFVLSGQAFSQNKPSTQQKTPPKKTVPQKKPVTQQKKPVTTPNNTPQKQVSKPVKEKKKTIRFQECTLAQFETMLLDSSKPGFVYLFSPGHSRTSNFNRMLEDTLVVNYVEKNFLAYKIDMENDYMQGLHYGVEDLPCVILIDNYRRERDRIYNYRKAEDFKKFLQQVYE